MKTKCLAIALLGALVVGACGGGGGDVVEGTDVVVDMFDNRFEFNEIKIPIGGSVNWVGAGRAPHNAVAADGSWTTESVFGGLDQFDGDEALLTYDQPGEYVFFCTYHGSDEGDGMAGVLIVGEGAT